MIRKVKINMDGEIPAEMKSELHELLKEYSDLLPCWCWDLFVYTAPAKGNSALSFDADPEYRKAYIYVRPDFYTENKNIREEMLVHEICHIIQAETSRWVDSMLFDLISDETIQNRLKKEYTRLLEATTMELTRTLLQLRT